MTTPARAQLILQLDEITHNGFLAALNAAADAAGIPRSFHVAIASRETNCKQILGDYRGGEAHGVGMTQIDIQHDLARTLRDSGAWNTPAGAAQLFAFGANMLAANIKAVGDYFEDVTPDEILQTAAAGYNCGVSRSIQSMQDDGDPDQHTTGHDYGADVMARKAVFDSIMGPT